MENIFCFREIVLKGGELVDFLMSLPENIHVEPMKGKPRWFFVDGGEVEAYRTKTLLYLQYTSSRRGVRERLTIALNNRGRPTDYRADFQYVNGEGNWSYSAHRRAPGLLLEHQPEIKKHLPREFSVLLRRIELAYQ